MKNYTAAEIRSIVEFHLADNKKKAEAEWDPAVAIYNAESREGIPTNVQADEAIARNMAYQVGDGLSSTLVPRSPELKITPKRDDLGEAANAQEGLVREAFTQGNIEKQLRKAATLAALHPYSIVKTVWKGRKKRPGYRAIAAKNIFFDPNAEDWDDIAYVGEITTLSLPEIRRRSKRGKKKGAVRYKRSVVEMLKAETLPAWLRTEELEEGTRQQLRDTLGQHVVVELIILDPDGGPSRFLHLVPGIEQPLLDIRFPHRYMRNPYEPISLEVAVKGLFGVAPYRRVQDLTKQLNQLYSLRAATAKASIPTTILNKSGLQNPDAFVDALTSASDPNDIVDVELANNNHSLADVVMFTQGPGNILDFSQAIADTQQEIDATIGLPSYLRAGESGADFATEIQMQSQDRSNRAGPRLKVFHDAITSIAIKSLQLYADKMSNEDVVYVRAATGEVSQEVTRQIAALNLFGAEDGEKPLALDYTVQVVDAATQNPVVRLQAVQPFMELLMLAAGQNMVDIAPIMVQLLRWLGLEEGIPDPNTMQAGAQNAAAGVVGQGATVPGVSGAQSGVGSGSGPRHTPTVPAV